MKVYIAEVWNTDSLEFDVLYGCFYTTEESAKDAVAELMDPECGASQTEPWEPDPEWGGISCSWNLDGAEIPTRIRELEEG
jgi:hypothetical protein